MLHSQTSLNPSVEPFQPNRVPWKWVFLWFLVGLVIRLSFLTLKPVWMDEVSTIIFSLGNSSFFTPLDQVVSLDELLQPLMARPDATPWDSIRYLLQENNHPPAYFAFAQPWMDWWTPIGHLPSVWISRALPAFLGALAIPVVFWAGRLSFRSNLAGHLSAAFMAVSPFGVAISQEIRHYGLATLVVAASLCCFAAFGWALRERRTPALGLCLLWVAINALAISIHYFTALTLLGEGMVFAVLAWRQSRADASVLWHPAWRRLYGVALGSLIGVLVWLPVWANFYGSPQTTFLALDFSKPIDWINPIAQALAGWIFMVTTPAYVASNWLSWVVIVVSILLALVLVIWMIPLLVRGVRVMAQQEPESFGLLLMGGFVVACVGIFFAISYLMAMDITRGHRYNFVYHSGVIITLGGLMASFWRQTQTDGSLSAALPFSKYRVSGRRVVQVLWTAGLIGAIFTVTNLSFPKYYNSVEFVNYVKAESPNPPLIVLPVAIFEQPTVIGAEYLAMGWEMKRHSDPENPASGWQTPPQFYVLPLGYGVETPVEERMSDLIQNTPKPFDLWFLNTDTDLSANGCPTLEAGNKGGHTFRHYLCEAS